MWFLLPLLRTTTLRYLFHSLDLLTRQLAETLACNLPLSKLNYFDALLPGASSGFIGDLLREQNNIACIVTVGSESLENEMHWLHVKYPAV